MIVNPLKYFHSERCLDPKLKRTAKRYRLFAKHFVNVLKSHARFLQNDKSKT